MTELEKRAHRRLLLGGIGAAVIVFTSPWWVVWAAGFIVMPMYWPQIPLDAAAWETCDTLAPDRTPRQQMVRDVVERVLPGKTREEIEATLGPAWSSSAEFKEHDCDMFYYIGQERFFILNCEWQVGECPSEALLIRLDDQQRFQSWYIYGSTIWPRMVSTEARRNFRAQR